MTDAEKKGVKSKDIFRFDGEGVQFKGKLIGVETVSDYRGEDVCRESMARLKSQVLARKEHKARIWINIKIDGVYISSQQSPPDASLSYTLPIGSISFVYKDATDARACGLIHRNFEGGEETAETSDKRNHRFFAIKTEKAANALLLDLKDLFQIKHEMTQKKIDEQKKLIEEEKKAVLDVTNTANSSSSIKVDSSTNAAVSGRQRAPSKAQVDLLNMESELATLNTTFSQLTTVAQPAAHSGLTDLQEVFGNVTDTYSAISIETSHQRVVTPTVQPIGFQSSLLNAAQPTATPQQQLMFGAQGQLQSSLYTNQFSQQQPLFYGHQTALSTNSYVTNPVFNPNAALTPEANRRQLGMTAQQFNPMAPGGQAMFNAPTSYPGVPPYRSNINIETGVSSSDNGNNVNAPILQPVLLHKSTTATTSSTPPANSQTTQAPKQPVLFADLVFDIGSAEKQRSKKEMAAVMSGSANRPTLSQLKNNSDFPK